MESTIHSEPFVLNDCALLPVAIGLRAQNFSKILDRLSTVYTPALYNRLWKRLSRDRNQEGSMSARQEQKERLTTPMRALLLVVLAISCVACQQERPPPEPELRADDVRQIGTDLIWKQCAVGRKWNGASCEGEPMAMSWEVAMRSCPHGYRLPSRDEFLGLLDGCDHTFQPGQAGQCRPCDQSQYCLSLFGVKSGWHWSTTIATEGDDLRMWAVEFDTGAVRDLSAKFQDGRARCVRVGRYDTADSVASATEN